MYGAGHSENLIGKVLKNRRNEAVIATKFGWVFDEERKEKLGYDLSPSFIISSCEDSLRHLCTDYIDLYLLHVGDYPAEKAEEVIEIMEKLVEQGKIRAYGWSTDSPKRASAIALGEHCTAIKHNENVFDDNAPWPGCGHAAHRPYPFLVSVRIHRLRKTQPPWNSGH